MRLLVSVANSNDATAALEGGAAFIDAKNPAAGSLGAVSASTFDDICLAVGGRRPVTAALGDAGVETDIEAAARTFAVAGAALVKVGFAGITEARRINKLLAATVRGARRAGTGGCGVIAVAYADAHTVASVTPAALPAIAAHNGAAGVLLDTADKTGPGLRDAMAPRAIQAWVAEAHEYGLLVALAGKLSRADLRFARDCGADVAGVRGAACDDGRNGRVSVERVRLLLAACEPLNDQTDGHRVDSSVAKSSVATMPARTCTGSALAK